MEENTPTVLLSASLLLDVEHEEDKNIDAAAEVEFAMTMAEGGRGWL